MFSKHNKGLKSLKSLVAVILIITLSISGIAVAININAIDNIKHMEVDNFEYNNIENKENENIETQDKATNDNKDNLIQKPHLALNENQKTITQDLAVQKITTEEMLDQFGIRSYDLDDLAPLIENRLSDEPLTMKVSDNTMEMNFSPEEAFFTKSSNPEPDSSSEDTRSSRAQDAGDNSGEATQLEEGGNWTGDWVRGSYNSQTQVYSTEEVDWFYIRVEEKGNLETEYIEIKINNSAPTSSNDLRRIDCFMFEPVSVLLSLTEYLIPGDNQGKSISTADSTMPQRLLDVERLLPQENGTLNAAPPISGVFFIQVVGFSNMYKLNYTIKPIIKTTIKPVVSPYDMNNYPDNGTVLLNKNAKSGKLIQHKNHWDWFELSNLIQFEGDTWPNKLSYDVDITGSASVPNSYHSWVEVWVLYESSDGNTLYLNGDTIDSGGSDTIQVGGVPSEPIRNNFEIRSEHAWIGLRVWSVGITGQGELFPQVYDGSADYTMTFDIKLQNNPPLLSQAKIEPEQDYYFMDDEITFKIKYRDSDNNIPLFVNLSIDGFEYAMTSSGSDYVSGVVYSYKVVGSDLDDSFYPHTFNYSTSDGLNKITFALSSPKDEFKVIEDQTPLIWDSAPNKMSFKEDDDVVTMELSQIFKDFDPADGLLYTIYSNDKYGQKFESSRIEVFIHSKNRLKFQLKSDQHGDDDVILRAEEMLKRGQDTYYFYASYKLNISISNQDDAPALDDIAKRQGYQDELIYFQIKATDPDILTDNDELTFSTNRSDNIGPDDIQGLSLIPDIIDNSRANISFTPRNEHVGKFLVKISVKDKSGLEDSINVEFEIANVNDPPVIKYVSQGGKKEGIGPNETSIEMEATEDKWFNITLEAVDKDLDIGITNDISYIIHNSTLTNPIVLTFKGGIDLTGQISVLPLNDDVGINYINLTVYDGKGGSDTLSLEIEVINVNDPPETPKITKPKGSEFSIAEEEIIEGKCNDEDLEIPDTYEKLTYTWYLIGGGKEYKLNKDVSKTRIEIKFITPKLPTDDTEIPPGNYTIRLEVTDAMGEMSYAEIYILLKEDFDSDLIPDTWEDRFDLNYNDRNDAVFDSDNDGYSNSEEYEKGTNPRDPTSKPSGKESSSSDDGGIWIIYAIFVVIVVVVLIIIFMMIGKRKSKDDMQDIDNLAYPEEGPEDEGGIGTSSTGTGVQPGAIPSQVKPGAPGSGIGMGMQPMPPGPGMPPNMYQMQMQMMHMQQMQKQKEQGKTMNTPQGQGQPQPKQTQKSSQLSNAKGLGGVQLTPKLPPGNNSNVTSTPSGQSTSKLNGDDVKGSEVQSNNNKCPNCGISVQSGWFLCPGCKSPLN